MDKTEWKLVNALYGDGQPPTKAEIDAALRKRQGLSTSNAPQTEAHAQTRLVAYLRKNNILFYHVPNGGYRRKEEAWALKSQGVQPGVPDICLPIARRPYHGLYIELKREQGGQVSEAQKWWLTELIGQNYKAVIAKGFDEAQRVVLDYLQLPRWEAA